MTSRRTELIIAITTLLLVLIFVLVTSPNSIALPLLVIPFFGLYLAIYILVKLLMTRKGRDSRLKAVISGLLASFPVLLIIFQSIHQLTIKDVLIIFALVGTAAFYLARVDFIE